MRTIHLILICHFVSRQCLAAVDNVTLPVKAVDGKSTIERPALESSAPMAKLIGYYCISVINGDRRLWTSLFSSKQDLANSDFTATAPTDKDIADSFEYESAWLRRTLRGRRIRAIVIDTPLWQKGVTFRVCVKFRLRVQQENNHDVEEIHWELPSVIRTKANNEERWTVPVPKKNVE